MPDRIWYEHRRLKIESIIQLEGFAEKYFSLIPNRLVTSPPIPDDPLTTDQLQVIIQHEIQYWNSKIIF